MAIGRRLCDDIRTDDFGGAGAVIYEHLLAPGVSQLLR
jgi:hypothetical protein